MAGQIPPIPQVQGGGPNRMQLILEALSQGTAKDPLGTAELVSSPIPVAGDVIGTAAGIERFAKDPSMEEAILTALGAAPFVSGAMLKDMVGPRLKQLIEEMRGIDSQSLEATAKQTRLDQALADVDEAQTLLQARKRPSPGIDELSRRRIDNSLDKELKGLEIEDPFTGNKFNAGNLSEQELLDLRTELRGKSRAIEMRRQTLEQEFARADELQKQLKKRTP